MNTSAWLAAQSLVRWLLGFGVVVVVVALFESINPEILMNLTQKRLDNCAAGVRKDRENICTHEHQTNKEMDLQSSRIQEDT